ncbi:MAG: tRNA (guanosine(46)-N7)-methyltransferase TrmB [Alphaproteobacteria bacterium]|nr:tRNA (guanosine(46)-N7)-methyltransferase TrmB [Alphaproteobacteria bacterium]
MTDPAKHGQLRTYGRRRGRPLRPHRAGLVQDLLPRLRVPQRVLEAPTGSVDPRGLFDPAVPEVWLELGFGGGEHLAAQARQNPGLGLIGCEPFENGVAALLGRIAAEAIGNIRILPGDGRPLLNALADGRIGRIFVLFPDPWPKKRHQRRRLVSPPMLDVFARLLADGGCLRLATDDPTYAEAMDQMLAGHAAFERCGGGAGWRPADAPVSRYEAKARRAGRVPAFFEMRRRARSAAHKG